MSSKSKSNNLPEREDHIIDVASARVYISQDEKYHEAFTKWRNNKSNRYGYRFVHDDREHIYVDGEGYADSRCENAERLSLQRCFGFLGMSMTVYLLFAVFRTLLLTMLYNDTSIRDVSFSERATQTIFPSGEVIAYSGFGIFTLIVMLLLYVFFIHMPVKVALPSSKVDPKFFAYSFAAAISMGVVFHAFDVGIAITTHRMGIDVSFFTLKAIETRFGLAEYILLELILTPMLYEIIFDGCVLQLFRQFGDRFAIIVASFASCCCYHSVSKMMFVFCWSIMLGIITIKSGSIVPAIVIRIVGGAMTLFLNSFWIEGSEPISHVIEIAVCLALLIISIFIIMLMRLKLFRPFRIDPDSTELSSSQKIREVLNSPWAVIWLTAVLLATILSVDLL